MTDKIMKKNYIKPETLQLTVEIRSALLDASLGSLNSTVKATSEDTPLSRRGSIWGDEDENFE